MTVNFWFLICSIPRFGIWVRFFPVVTKYRRYRIKCINITLNESGVTKQEKKNKNTIITVLIALRVWIYVKISSVMHYFITRGTPSKASKLSCSHALFQRSKLNPIRINLYRLFARSDERTHFHANNVPTSLFKKKYAFTNTTNVSCANERNP